MHFYFILIFGFIGFNFIVLLVFGKNKENNKNSNEKEVPFIEENIENTNNEVNEDYEEDPPSYVEVVK